jgi:hypothetical protein
MKLAKTIPDHLRVGAYANGASILHSMGEFLVDFLKIIPSDAPGSEEGVVVARVTMSPATMRAVIDAMEANLEDYEKRFGPVPRMPQVQ